MHQNHFLVLNRILQWHHPPRGARSAIKINETDKIWHYQDPSGKVQGPFSMVQLRKWSNTGYFPADLRIWRTNEKQDDSFLLTDALVGNFQADPPLVDSGFLKSHSPHLSSSKVGSETNLPSPTLAQAATSGTKGKSFESKWSPTTAQPAGSLLGANSLPSGNGELQRPAIVIPEISQSPHSSTPYSIKLLNSANSPQMRSQSTLSGESPRVQVISHLLPAPDSGVASVNTVTDMKGLQNRSACNLSGISTAPGASGLAPSDRWGGPMPGQPNIQPSAAPSNVPWGNLNMGWGGPVSANSNQGWVVSGQMPAPANTNAGWVAHGQAQAPGNANLGLAAAVQGQAPGNAFPGWVPPGQGQTPINANLAWVPLGQGPPPGNANPSWVASPGNVGSWGSEKNHSGDRFSSQRDGGSQGGDTGYGGGKPWNRQSSFGRGDSSRPPFRGHRVCTYHESGHCKKGAACDYLHT
ncbi:hypothetical protein GH714_030559 [Hevea brasiliensis]|uniref:C3H1-type domain-containing protein n=1 Tax=Hevea brasiliensis TaxID=3981 RepID=A0A6A6LN38_HEVBR|nr:hypothetical protein GH714_030559 [Hevea brasiliensis]